MEPAWRLIRILGGVAAGLVVLFGVVILSTWLASLVSGLGMGDAPTTQYLLLNLGGSAVAALLAGMVACGLARSLIAPAILAVLLLATWAAGGSQATQGQPSWYPLAVTVVGIISVLLGGFLAPRGAVRVAA